MNHSSSERIFNSESPGGAVMAELFEAIGFDVGDEDSYNLIAEYAENSGERSRVHRGDATLHGRCWKVGEGLEVWSVLYERDSELYYADCRPAFRSRYVRAIQPWELIEYDEDGEAIIRAHIENGSEVIFELQNLTEINPHVFRETKLYVALAGLAYTAHVGPSPVSRLRGGPPSPRFELAERLPEFQEDACENDYVISGRVLAWRELKNRVTGSDLMWVYVDAAKMRLELLISRRMLRGQLSIGAAITANIWLQGHVLEAADISARYEGVDHDYETSDFWATLRRGN